MRIVLVFSKKCGYCLWFKKNKKLAFANHPDRGGKTEIMQEINAEYDYLFKLVKYIHKDHNGKTYEKKAEKKDFSTEDLEDVFKNIINKIINFNCKIELCGRWLWVFNAFNYKKQLKDLGFFYCSNKKAWAWCEPEDLSNNKHKLTLDEIRKIHGSEVIKEEDQKEQPKRPDNKKVIAITKNNYAVAVRW